jgi:CRP-like cAMP-binding protein
MRRFIVTSHIPAELIRGVRLFHNLSHDQIQQLLNAAEEVNYEEGKVVFEEGEKGRALYVIIEGSVRIALAAPITSDTELMTLGPQGVFGESSFFHRALHHASAVCMSPVRLARLRRQKYRELLEADSLAAYKLAANAADLLGERLQQTNEWIERMLQGRSDAELLSKWKRFRRGIGSSSGGQIGGFRV